MEHLDDLDNLEAKNVVNGRTGYDASSVNQSYLSEASGSPSYLSAIEEAPEVSIYSRLISTELMCFKYFG